MRQLLTEDMMRGSEKRLGLQIPASAMVCAQLSGGAHRCRFESLRKYEIKSLLCVASLA